MFKRYRKFNLAVHYKIGKTDLIMFYFHGGCNRSQAINFLLTIKDKIKDSNHSLDTFIVESYLVRKGVIVEHLNIGRNWFI